MLAFDHFRLDPDTGQCWRRDEIVRLSPRARAVLHYLVTHAGQLVSPADLRQAVWDDTGGSAAALKVCIGEIRKALQDDARSPRFIETQPRHGYRFIAPLLGTGSPTTSHQSETSEQSVPPAAQFSPASLVGRDTELSQLQHAFARARQGERQFVFVSGEPGVGKTTLVNAFVSQLVTQAEPVWVSRGQCVEQYGAGEAYLPLLEALGRLGREPDGPEIVAVLAQYAPTWLAQLPALVLPADREALQRTLVGATRERMLREIAEALEVLTTRRPAILVLEDLHWSDQSTLELLSYLLRRQGSARLLLLGTFRSTEVLSSDQVLRRLVQDLHGRDHGEEISLRLLDEEQVCDYLEARLGGEGAVELSFPELAQLVHGRTEGNPLFMVTMVEYLQEAGLLLAPGEQRQLNSDWAEAANLIPDGLRQVIERQFESLPAPEQKMLEAASVGGIEFAVTAVVAGSEQALEAVEAACAGLAARGHFVEAAGLEEWPDGSLGGRYRFRHALYQNVLYERMSAARRVQLHRRIGTRKETAYQERTWEISTELAVHFERGHHYQKTAQYCEQAGRTAARRNAHTEAVGHFRKGLALLQVLPDTPERAQQELILCVALGSQLIVTHGFGYPEVEQVYSRAQTLCQQIEGSPLLSSILGGLCTFYLDRAELAKAYTLAEQILRSAEHLDRPARLMWAHFQMGIIRMYQGELVQARSHLEQALALHDPRWGDPRVSGSMIDPKVTIDGFYLPVVTWLLGYPIQAQHSIQAQLNDLTKDAHPFSSVYAYHGSAWNHIEREEGRAAQEAATTLATLADAHDFSFFSAQAVIFHGAALSLQGDPTGIDYMQRGLTASESTGTDVFRTSVLSMLARGYGRAGQPREGLATVADALAFVERTGERFYEAELYRLKGEILLKAERRMMNAERKAESCFQTAIATARCQEAKMWELRAATSLGRLWQQQGKTAEARQLLEEVYGWFTEGFETVDLQEAKALLSALGSKVEPQQVLPLPPPPPLPSLAPPAASVSVPSEFPPVSEQSQDALPSPLEQAHTPFSPPEQPSSPEPTASALFRPEGEYWTLAFDGQVCQVQGTRGMQYLAQLLRAPYQEFFAVALVSGNTAGSESAVDGVGQRLTTDLALQAGLGDAGEVLDARAQAAYKQRIAELREDLEEAQAFNDEGRVEKLQGELEFLMQELTQAVGLGGRSRKAASSTERARVNVTRAIRTAITRIAASHPSLGQYLEQTIKTGTACSYTPDPSQELPWQF